MTPTGGPVVNRPILLAQAIVAILLAAKLWMSAAAPPIGDEAYYLMWGQKLGWSYLDHPPLHAWLLRVMSVFGWNYFSLRVLTWLTLAGTLAIFWAWARRLKPEDPAAWFWPSAAIYLSSPLFLAMSSIAFHDHLLIFLCIASAHCFLVFAERWEATGRGWRWLYGAAALLGLAVLTKYNGVLFGVGVALFFIAHRPLRPLWRAPHLYLSAALAVAMQAPVFWWNLTQTFASFNFHLSERWGGDLLRLRPINVVGFLLLALLFVSPFLFVPIFRLIRRPLGTPFADRARSLALSVFAVSSLAMLALSLFVEVFFYWNIVAFLLLMPLVGGWIGSRWGAVLHYAYGLVFAAFAIVNFTIVPVGNLIGRYDWTISSTFGWPDVAARIKVLRRDHPVGFIAVSRYTTAAQLGYALRDPDVVAIAGRHDQYDYWFDPAAHIGESALVVADSYFGTGELKRYFETLELIEDVPYAQYGHTIYRPRLYLGTGFHLPR